MKPVVMFEFSGLGEFEQTTLNYWEHLDASFNQPQGRAFYKLHDEKEKRVYLNSRNLDNIKKYIKRVDVAFYADANFPRDSRKLLRTINAEYPNAVYHKTMSGLLTAGKGVSFDEVMKLVETATEQKPLFQKESTVDGDLDMLQKIIKTKHNKKPYNISEKRFWALFSRTGKTNNPKSKNCMLS